MEHVPVKLDVNDDPEFDDSDLYGEDGDVPVIDAKRDMPVVTESVALPQPPNAQDLSTDANMSTTNGALENQVPHVLNGASRISHIDIPHTTGTTSKVVDAIMSDVPNPGPEPTTKTQQPASDAPNFAVLADTAISIEHVRLESLVTSVDPAISAPSASSTASGVAVASATSAAPVISVASTVSADPVVSAASAIPPNPVTSVASATSTDLIMSSVSADGSIPRQTLGFSEPSVPEDVLRYAGAELAATTEEIHVEEVVPVSSVNTLQPGLVTDTELVNQDFPAINSLREMIDRDFVEAARANRGDPTAEFEEDSDPALSGSDSSDSSDTDSDDSSSDDDSDYESVLLDPAEAARMLMRDEPDDGGGATQPPRTVNEEMEKPGDVPNIKIDDIEIVELGKISGVLPRHNCIRINATVHHQHNVLQPGSALCLSDRTLIRPLSDTIGQVLQPTYIVYFESAEEIERFGLMEGQSVYYPNIEEARKFVFYQQLQKERHTDASNFYDEEAGGGDVEFSDDEQEAAYKKALKDRKRAKADGDDLDQPMNNILTPAPPQHHDGRRGRAQRGGPRGYRGDYSHRPQTRQTDSDIMDRANDYFRNEDPYGEGGAAESNANDTDGYRTLQRPDNYGSQSWAQPPAPSTVPQDNMYVPPSSYRELRNDGERGRRDGRGRSRGRGNDRGRNNGGDRTRGRERQGSRSRQYGYQSGATNPPPFSPGLMQGVYPNGLAQFTNANWSPQIPQPPVNGQYVPATGNFQPWPQPLMPMNGAFNPPFIRPVNLDNPNPTGFPAGFGVRPNGDNVSQGSHNFNQNFSYDFRNSDGA